MGAFVVTYLLVGAFFKVIFFILAVICKILITTLVWLGCGLYWLVRFAVRKCRS